MMKLKTIFFITTFLGYALLLTLLLLAVKEIEYHILKDISNSYQYVLLNALVFTFVFGAFYKTYGQTSKQKRWRKALFIYIAFLIIGAVTTSLLYTFKNSSDTFRSEFGWTLSFFLIGFYLLWYVVLIFGIITFGFMEGIRHFILKKLDEKPRRKYIPYIYVGVATLLLTIVSVIALQPTYKYYKTEKIPDTNLQAVIYIQDNYKTIAIANSSGSYASAYFELQDLEGNILAKQNWFTRCEVQIEELGFSIEDNKLYFTKFSYIDLTDYSYHCFGNGM